MIQVYIIINYNSNYNSYYFLINYDLIYNTAISIVCIVHNDLVVVYLHQRGYVFSVVCLSVCLSAGLWKKTASLIFMKLGGRV